MMYTHLRFFGKNSSLLSPRYLLLATFAPRMRLTNYVIHLLLTHDCVIVPDFGGFVAHRESAYVLSGSGMCYPPRRTVGFNPQLTINDGLLAQTYMDALDLSYPEALRALHADVNRLQSTLNSGGKVAFEGVGTLQSSPEGTIRFTPQSPSGIATPDLYGLVAMQLNPIEERDTTSKETEHMAEQPVAVDEPGDARESCYVIRLPKKIVHRAAAAVAALLLCLVLTVPSSDGSTLIEAGGNFLTTCIPQKPKTEEKKQQQTEKKAQQPEKKVQSEAKKKSSPKPAAQREAKPAPAPASYYTIVLASDVREQGALDFIALLGRQGFEGAEMLLHNNRRRVIFGHFNTEREAYNELQQLRRRSPHFTEAWVYRVK